MAASIVFARDWDADGNQRYLAVDPSGEEVSLYQNDNSTTNEDNNLAKLASRGGFDGIQCLQYSRADVGLAAVGQLNGSAYVFDVTSQSSLLRLKPKQARPCNAIALNGQGLAVLGFDRGRQDHSVQVWDVQHYSRTGSNDHISRPLVKYVQNEAVLSTTFLDAEPTNVVAGSYKFLREFDVRAEQPVYQLSTKCTSGITADPFNANQFASFAEDGSVAFWDRRKMLASTAASGVIAEAPLLTFSRLLSDQRRSPACFKFSTLNTGEFSALFAGDLVRRWQLGASPGPTPGADGASLFVARVSDVKTKYERVVSFDYAPNVATEKGVDLVCMRQSGSVFRMHVVSSQETVAFNAFNDLTFSGPAGTFTTMVQDAVEPEPEPEAEADADADDASDASQELLVRPATLLDNDVCSTIRRRAALGYGVDLAHNLAVVEQQLTVGSQDHLRNLWRWLEITAGNVARGSMVAGDYDLGYVGVLGIWQGVDGLRGQRRFRGAGPMDAASFAGAVRELAERRLAQIRDAHSTVLPLERRSDKDHQRRLCMYVAGWDFGSRELEDKYRALVAKDQYERAAGWAVFNGDVGKAVEILGSAKSERLRIMSTAVAGYLSYRDSPINSRWREQCRRLALDLENPYLRVIFAFIADNNWWDVLDEAALPLRERLGVALRFLPDNELSEYLDSVSRSAVARGEIEGIILTGVTPRGVDLLQSYVDRTSDVQTACMVAAHGCPRYFEDARVASWTESYRQLLNSWSLFSVRAKFDVARARLSQTMDGKTTTAAIPRQVYLQCVRCNRNIADSRRSRAGGYAKLVKGSGRLGRPSTSCPHCGAALPRCAICLLPQGTPLPRESLILEGDVDEAQANIATQFRQWFSFCLSCNHGMHAGHAEEWFSKHYICAVPDCDCKCNSK